MSIEDESKEFEAWVERHHVDLVLLKTSDDIYFSPNTSLVWQGWLARARLDGWRPIESAPRDGTKVILGYRPDEDHEFGFVGQGRWWPSDEDGPDNMGHDAGFMDCNFEFFQCGRSFGNPSYQGPGVQPTHWQPLPNPPKEDGE